MGVCEGLVCARTLVSRGSGLGRSGTFVSRVRPGYVTRCGMPRRTVCGRPGRVAGRSPRAGSSSGASSSCCTVVAPGPPPGVPERVDSADHAPRARAIAAAVESTRPTRLSRSRPFSSRHAGPVHGSSGWRRRPSRRLTALPACFLSSLPSSPISPAPKHSPPGTNRPRLASRRGPETGTTALAVPSRLAGPSGSRTPVRPRAGPAGRARQRTRPAGEGPPPATGHRAGPGDRDPMRPARNRHDQPLSRRRISGLAPRTAQPGTTPARGARSGPRFLRHRAGGDRPALRQAHGGQTPGRGPGAGRGGGRRRVLRRPHPTRRRPGRCW